MNFAERTKLIVSYGADLLDIIIYRAWISTLALIILFLLFITGEAHEILHGVTEELRFDLGGWLGFSVFEGGWGFSQFSGVREYASLFLAAEFLSLILGSIVYISGKLASTPHRIERESPNKSQFLVRLWALIALVLTLAIVHLSFLEELQGHGKHQFLWISDRVWLGFAFFSVTLTLPLVSFRWLSRNFANLLCIIYIVIVSLFLFLVPFHGDLSNVPLLLSFSAPSLTLLTVIICYSYFSAKKFNVNVLVTLALFMLSIIVFARWPPSVIWQIGTIPVVLIFVAWLSVLLMAIVILLSRVPPWVRIDLIAIGIVAVAVWLGWTRPERYGREALVSDQSTPPAPGTPNSGPKPENGDPAGARFALHADGGGLRAALFTAETLALADDLSCGEFGSHVFAASGVSGGGLGIATWAAMRQEFVEAAKEETKEPWSECKMVRAKLSDSSQLTMKLPGPLQTLVLDTLLVDHLSTVLADYLTSDLIWPWGSATRGQALVDSWQSAALSALAVQEPGLKAPRAFATKLSEVDAGLTTPPLLMFTATDADSGERVVFTNAKWPPHTDLPELALGVAALHTARFPAISPAGLVSVGKKDRRLVDGGLFDNSGAATLRDMLFEASLQKTWRGKVVVARINGNESDQDLATCNSFRRWLAENGYIQWYGGSAPPKSTIEAIYPVGTTATPPFNGLSAVSAYNAVRDAHAEEAVRALVPQKMSGLVSRLMTPEVGLDMLLDFEKDCEDKSPKQSADGGNLPACVVKNREICDTDLVFGRKAPLGWYMSRAAAEHITVSAVKSALRLVKEMNSP